MKRAVLLDVSAIMYRAYFANMNFRTKNEPTGAVYGFINTLLSIIKEFNPDYMAAAFDVKRSSLKRTEIYADYKSNRQSTPEDLVAQIPRIEEVLDAFNINRYRIESYEADDVLGSIAKKIAKDDLEVIIVTGDKDLSQLVEKNITIALLGKGAEGEKFGMLRTAEDVVNYLGVVPEKIPDLFGLIGDKSDGIPGVTKIGEKKALAIFSKYDSLEKIYENIDDLKNIEGIGPSLIKNLTNEKDIAFLSRELAKIFTNLNIDTNEKNLKYSMDKEKLYELCKILEFKMFIKKLNLEEKTQTSNFDHKPVLLSLFDKIENVEKWGDFGFKVHTKIPINGRELSRYFFYDNNWLLLYASETEIELVNNLDSNYPSFSKYYFLLNSEEIIYFYRDSFSRINLKDNIKRWELSSNSVNSFNSFPKNTRLDNFSVSKNGNVWTFMQNYTLLNGEKGIKSIKINIETGEVVN